MACHHSSAKRRAVHLLRRSIDAYIVKRLDQVAAARYAEMGLLIREARNDRPHEFIRLRVAADQRSQRALRST